MGLGLDLIADLQRDVTWDFNKTPLLHTYIRKILFGIASLNLDSFLQKKLPWFLYLFINT